MVRLTASSCQLISFNVLNLTKKFRTGNPSPQSTHFPFNWPRWEVHCGPVLSRGMSVVSSDGRTDGLAAARPQITLYDLLYMQRGRTRVRVRPSALRLQSYSHYGE